MENENGKHYIGYTTNLKRRIKDHNHSKSRWTKKKGPWRLVYEEEYATKEKAFLKERQIKKYKGGKPFKELITK